MQNEKISEPEFRKIMHQTLDQMVQALDAMDPDCVEVELAMGALTLTFADRSRCIVSGQPSVRQLWLAIAAQGKAYHFNWDVQTQSWRDDKQSELEFFSCMKDFLKTKSILLQV